MELDLGLVSASDAGYGLPVTVSESAIARFWLAAGEQTAGPLSGIRVVEVGRYIAAPYAGRLLAGLGATVVKVEDRGGGDPMRSWESGDRPYSPQFAAYNLSKSGITLDLKQPDDVATFAALTDSADVLLENFRPGVMARLGVAPDTLLGRNPRLIVCSVTGFGPIGPYADRPTYDTVVSATSGLYSLLLPLSSASPVGPAMSDLLAGLFAAQGVLAALNARHATGAGQLIDVSMLGSVLGFLGEAVTSAGETGRSIEPNTRQRRAQAYGAVAGDGRAFVVHLSVPDKFWQALCRAMERPDWLADPRLADRTLRYENYAILEDLIRYQALTKPRDVWFEAFTANDLPHAPMNTLLDLRDDPQIAAMGLLEALPMPGRPMTVVGSPVTFSGTPVGAARPAPLLGADDDALRSTDARQAPGRETP